MTSWRMGVFVGVLWLVGCANPMKELPEEEVKPAPDGKAQVVFLRPSSYGGAIDAGLYEVEGEQPEFIAIGPVGCKIVHRTDPGKKKFMVVSEAADFLRANLEGGKTYYVLISPRMGFWKARFSLYPVRKKDGEYSMQSSEFPEWLEDTVIMENTKDSRKWAEENQADVNQKYQNYWKEWKEKSEEEKKQQTLRKEDGVNEPR